MVALATAELFQPITGMPRALVAWLCCRPDVRARHRCAGDALLLGKEGYCVRRRRAWGLIFGDKRVVKHMAPCPSKINLSTDSRAMLFQS